MIEINVSFDWIDKLIYNFYTNGGSILSLAKRNATYTCNAFDILTTVFRQLSKPSKVIQSAIPNQYAHTKRNRFSLEFQLKLQKPLQFEIPHIFSSLSSPEVPKNKIFEPDIKKIKQMSEESKRSGGGALVPPSPASSNDRKSSTGSTAAGKKVIIKSADMKEDIQKEAVEIAIAVKLFSFHTEYEKKQNPLILLHYYFFF